MKSKADICHHIKGMGCEKCLEMYVTLPCNHEVPNYIPDEQILRFVQHSEK